MNLLELITEKSSLFIVGSDDVGINSVLNHMEIAMKHYDTA